MSFTILERVVIESIFKKNNCLSQIHNDTDLDERLIMNILSSLTQAKVVVCENDRFEINQKKKTEIIESLTSVRHQLTEVNTLIKSCMRKALIQSQDKPFHFKKVYMNEKDKTILGGLLKSVESFIESVEKNQGETKKETIIFWGSENYAESIRSYIS